MTHPNICFIGAGNMATSLIGGMIAQDYPPQHICACDIHQEKLDTLQQSFQVNIDSKP